MVATQTRMIAFSPEKVLCTPSLQTVANKHGPSGGTTGISLSDAVNVFLLTFKTTNIMCTFCLKFQITKHEGGVWNIGKGNGHQKSLFILISNGMKLII